MIIYQSSQIRKKIVLVVSIGESLWGIANYQIGITLVIACGR